MLFFLLFLLFKMAEQWYGPEGKNNVKWSILNCCVLFNSFLPHLLFNYLCLDFVKAHCIGSFEV